MNEDTDRESRPPPGARSRAPYDASVPAAGRPGGRRAWDVAGASWDAEAERLRTYYRTQRGLVGRLRAGSVGLAPADRRQARARARACRRVAKALDRLIAHGYVIWHDRTVAGTSMVADHVLVGPDGLTVVQTLPRSAGAAGPYVSDAVKVERHQITYRTTAVAELLDRHLPVGWNVLVFGLVCVDGRTPVVAATPQVVSRKGAVELTRRRTRGLTPVQVADLALIVEDLFPPAP